MKKLTVLSLMFCLLSAPAFAARQVYLKDGGVIMAKSVWRSEGRVHVLVNRDILTSFSVAEINIKRTFPHIHKAAGKRDQKLQPVAANTSPASASAKMAAGTKQSGTKQSVSLPSLPKLSEKKPENLLPSSGTGGTIKQHKKEMAERANE